MSTAARPFAEFNRLLARVVEQGVPAGEGVALVAGAIDAPRFRTTLDGVAAALREGAALPNALRRFPDAFPADYAAQVEFGIRANRLPEILRQVETYHALRARSLGHLRRLAFYVVSVTVMCVAMLAALLPLSEIHRTFIDGLGLREVPGPTALWLWAGDHPVLFLLALPAIVAGIAALLRLGKRAVGTSRLEYWIPLWGRVLKSRDLAMFCSALGMQVASGAALAAGVQAAAAGTSNRYLRRILDRVAVAVEEGRPLSSALYEQRFFPRTLVWAVSMGEEAGDLGAIFRMFSGVYAAEMERGYETLHVLMTPVAILLMGNVVLLTIMSVLMPLFNLQSRLAG